MFRLQISLASCAYIQVVSASVRTSFMIKWQITFYHLCGFRNSDRISVLLVISISSLVKFTDLAIRASIATGDFPCNNGSQVLRFSGLCSLILTFAQSRACVSSACLSPYSVPIRYLWHRPRIPPILSTTSCFVYRVVPISSALQRFREGSSVTTKLLTVIQLLFSLSFSFLLFDAALCSFQWCSARSLCSFSSRGTTLIEFRVLFFYSNDPLRAAFCLVLWDEVSEKLISYLPSNLQL